MDCLDANAQLVGLLRGRLPPDEQEALRSHLSACGQCRREESAERALDDLLDRALPRLELPSGLEARLEHLAQAHPAARSEPAPTVRWARFAAPVLAAVAVAVLLVLAVRPSPREQVARAALVSEAVSDHLRALADERGPVLASSESHQVKPWFEGRLDFAPIVPAPDVADLRLRGGSVGYFLDRKAAVVDYTLRRHAVTLLAFRPDGLPLSEPGGPGSGGRVGVTSLRGFHVATWRAGDVGYALVSDVPAEEVGALASTFAALTAR